MESGSEAEHENFLSHLTISKMKTGCQEGIHHILMKQNKKQHTQNKIKQKPSSNPSSFPFSEIPHFYYFSVYLAKSASHNNMVSMFAFNHIPWEYRHDIVQFPCRNLYTLLACFSKSLFIGGTMNILLHDMAWEHYSTAYMRFTLEAC